LPLDFYFLTAYPIDALSAEHQVEQILPPAAIGIIYRPAVRKYHAVHLNAAYIKIAEGELRYIFAKNRNHLLSLRFIIFYHSFARLSRKSNRTVFKLNRKWKFCPF
jgi:hypothetical protein